MMNVMLNLRNRRGCSNPLLSADTRYFRRTSIRTGINYMIGESFIETVL